MRNFITFLTLMVVQTNVALAAATTEKAIPSLTNEPIGVGNYVQMFLGLFLIVAIIFGMAWLMRRMSNLNNGTASDLKVLGGVSVGQRERIVLVQAGDTQLLVGVAPGQVTALHVMDEAIVKTTAINEQNTKTPSGFAEKLHAAIKSRNA